MDAQSQGSGSRRGSVQNQLVLDEKVEDHVRGIRGKLDVQVYAGHTIREEWIELGMDEATQGLAQGAGKPRDSQKREGGKKKSPMAKLKKRLSFGSGRKERNRLVILTNGSSFSDLVLRVEKLEKEEVMTPRFFVGVAVHDGSFVTFVFRWVGPRDTNNVTSLKLAVAGSAVMQNILEMFYPDIAIQNLQSANDIGSKEDLFRRPRARTNRFSGEIHQVVSRNTQVDELSIDFISENEELLEVWDAIRHKNNQDTTWMVLGYHNRDESNPKSSPEPVPILLASGGGGIRAFAEDLILESVHFRPGWLYWIYARINVEDVEGTGRLQVDDQGERRTTHLGRSSKFILMSFCRPDEDNRALLPTMALRLLHHRPNMSRALKHHLYMEARSLGDISEMSVVNRLLAHSHGRRIVLTVFIGSGSGGTLRQLAESKTMLTPLLIRIDPHSSLKDLKKRVSTSYNYPLDRIVVMRLKRKNTTDVLRSLVDSASRRNFRSEADLNEALREASSQVNVDQLDDNEARLQELGLVSGDELYIQLVKSTSKNKSHSKNLTNEVSQYGLVQRRRMQIEEFLAMRKRQQEFRRPMWESLRKIEISDSESDLGDDDETLSTVSSGIGRDNKALMLSSIAEEQEHQEQQAEEARARESIGTPEEEGETPRSVGGGPSEMDLKTQKDLISKRKPSMLSASMLNSVTLKKRGTPKSREKNQRSSSTEQHLVRESNVLLGQLAKKAGELGARMVDDEDLIILEERVLGDGRTARVREGLLLCKLEQLPQVMAKDKHRKSRVVSSRHSWTRMRKNSLNPAKFFEEDLNSLETSSMGSSSEDESSKDDGSFEYVALKVAVKMFTAKFINQNVFNEFQEEISVLAGLEHPSIVQILGVHINHETNKEDISQLMIMYELMPRGSLKQLRETEDWGRIPFEWKLKMAIEVAKGIEYLHTRNPPIVHRDLKSDNLLVDDDLTLKIGDFGLSTPVKRGNVVRKKCGTAGWVAPEVLLDADTGYGIEADVFSFGIILWEIITSDKNPLAGMVEDKLLKELQDGARPELPEDDMAKGKYNQIARDCWEYDPSKRPQISDVVKRLEDVLQLRFTMNNN